jgi:hypothetical protein
MAAALSNTSVEKNVSCACIERNPRLLITILLLSSLLRKRILCGYNNNASEANSRIYAYLLATRPQAYLS